MEVDAGTRLCALIGHPVAHSVSPQMHNAAFRALGLDYIYLAFDVESGQLARAVRGLRALGAAGFNVTIPHKVSVMRLLDGLDNSARDAGAVNTVALGGDRLIGYNTDVYGIENALKSAENLKPGRAMIIGAGGAARATAIALLRLGYMDLVIANRRLWRAAALARRLKIMGVKAKAVELGDAGRYSRSCAVIVNTTPIGMWPETTGTPLKAKEISGDAVVLDLVYNPTKTIFLEEARRAGAEAISGIVPLVEQGVKAFELWTGVKPPKDVMLRAAEDALRMMMNEG